MVEKQTDEDGITNPAAKGTWQQDFAHFSVYVADFAIYISKLVCYND